MEILLLGTGSADGWPSPFCGCASCAAAQGNVRGQTAALVDQTLMLDCGPEAPRAAVRAGHTLKHVRHILFTHGHPDHVGPAALLFRHWADRAEPLDLVGPKEALDQCRDWVGPADLVRFLEVEPGDSVDLVSERGAYRVQVLEAAHPSVLGGGAVLYDVSRGSHRLLWATDTGPLPAGTHAAIAGAGFDAVFLEETFGNLRGHNAGHHDLESFPRTLAQLRESGAANAATEVVAVHLSHYNPPPNELAEILRGWGARAGADGEIMKLGQGDSQGAGAASRTLVLGGVRSGKSVHAEELLAAEPAVTYLATGGSGRDDPEWAARVELHQGRRPAAWRTAETVEIAELLRTATIPILLDCLGTWLTARIDLREAWDGGPIELVEEDMRELVAAWRACPARAVAVSNEVGSGVVPATASGRLFRDLLGKLNSQMAAESEQVVLVVAGIPVPLRG
ncbi:bifunctional adenosylcobinamide kinase/adenosylcobinamide-phosphate guanylyltransferase [Tomitella biformata]|uniref:bifunctional adenosylcobinamide kinase/adenosylcobinamide-phosphate guanylyltransferase n=1 Tax=Tomitella biformata TaxID=630403 RepID=UPI0004678F1D|nr:bifunctional adenosylcobinamide kinase/adenosylcobinamide-phosphate guanylyltransferase [Tomitella biformata]